MKLIIGLGNPEKKYENTRHNTGFIAVDRVVDDWQNKPKFHGQLAEKEVDGEKILFFKPSTYYNSSGLGARAVRDFYEIDNGDILVVHDELALPFGTVRTRVKTSDDAGNNGIKDLNQHLGKDYARVKVGIGQQERTEIDINFVLSPFNQAEIEKLPEIFTITDQIIGNFIRNHFEHTSYKIG